MLQLPALRSIPSPNYSSRGGRAVQLIVVHDCEGSYAGSVSWFARPASKVSAHWVMSEDGAQATQMVSPLNKAWHVCDFNPISEGIEAAGYSAKGLGAPEWKMLAAITAFRLKANNLPCTWASGGVGAGFCQHGDLGVVGGGHHDICPIGSDVWKAFIAMVADAYTQEMPAQWLTSVSAPVANLAPVGFKPSGTTRHDLQPPSIEWVQMTLNALGVASPPLVVDGLDGYATQRAIVKFQQMHQLFIDGVPGPKSIAALESA